MALAVGHQDARQRSDFHGFTLVARGFHPAVAIIDIELAGLGLGLTLGRRQRLIAFIPAVLDMLLDGVDVNRLHLTDAALENGAPREEEAVGFLGGLREFTVDQEVGGSTDLAPVFVESGHRQNVGDVDVVDEVHGLLPEVLELGNAVGGEVRGTGHAAHYQALDVRILAAENGMQARGAGLLPKGLEIVLYGEQVHFGRQLVGRMSPVAVGKNAQLTAVDEFFQPGLEWP